MEKFLDSCSPVWLPVRGLFIEWVTKGWDKEEDKKKFIRRRSIIRRGGIIRRRGIVGRRRRFRRRRIIKRRWIIRRRRIIRSRRPGGEGRGF